MFNLPDSHTKIFKISMEDFENNVGSPRKSIRYSYLDLKGNDVNIKWNPEDNTFKVSGQYGT